MLTNMPNKIYEPFDTRPLEWIPPQSRIVLDLGCGAGAVGAAMKTQPGCRVVGTTLN